MLKIFLPLLLISTAAFAQADNSMLVVGKQQQAKPASQVEQERIVNGFPDWAVTRAGVATGGAGQDVPASPVSPAAPGANQGTTNPPAPAVPVAPVNPATPVSKLWPADTVPIFIKSCVGYRAELLVPCHCVIGKLMTTMPHNEFLAETANNTIEDDVRIKNARVECAVDAASKH